MPKDIEAQFQPHTEARPISDLGSPSSPNLNILRSRKSNIAPNYYPQLKGRKWQPGQEPGLSASAVHGPNQKCEITVVDFSQDNFQVLYLENDTLAAFLDGPKAEWVVCRWINVNGISGNVIQMLASHKRFHRLAIEDMLNNRNRTKADWYADHTYGKFLEQSFGLLHVSKEDQLCCHYRNSFLSTNTSLIARVTPMTNQTTRKLRR